MYTKNYCWANTFIVSILLVDAYFSTYITHVTAEIVGICANHNKQLLVEVIAQKVLVNELKTGSQRIKFRIVER